MREKQAKEEDARKKKTKTRGIQSRENQHSSQYVRHNLLYMKEFKTEQPMFKLRTPRNENRYTDLMDYSVCTVIIEQGTKERNSVLITTVASTPLPIIFRATASYF